MSMSVACPGPLTRRSSERELANGNKKRATSAGGLLDRKGDGEYRVADGWPFAYVILSIYLSCILRRFSLLRHVCFDVEFSFV